MAQLKRPPVLAGAAFASISSAIVVNAVFLQAAQHPAPLFSSGGRTAAVATKPDELVRAVQDALKQRGYYSGPLDGLAGPQTQTAIKDFQIQAGLEPSGVPTPELLSDIRSTNRTDLAPVPTRVVGSADRLPVPPPPAAMRPVAGPRAVEPDGMVAAVQDALARAAYGPLTVDGVPGPATEEAVKRFQRDHNLAVTGQITEGLIVELRAAGALGGG
jgi:peptidoglycan hydrolase-like protein with peptidoglycan-binding domain